MGRYAAGNWHNFVHRSVSVDVLGAVSPFPDFFFYPLICYPVKGVWHIEGLKCSVFLIVKAVTVL